MLEFAIAEMAAELAITTWSARRLIGDALETRHRLPRIWRRVRAGEVPEWIARKVAQATRLLTRDRAATVDCELVEYADGRLPYGRFAELLEAKVIEADPDAAAARERAAAEQRYAKVGQSNEHGQKTLYVKTSVAEMARIDATVAHLADGLRTLGDSDDQDRRRAKAMLIMANPVQAVALLQALATATHRTGPTAPDRPAWDPDDTPLPDSCGVPGGPSPGSGPPDPTAPDPPGEPSGHDERFLRPFHPGEVPPCACSGGTFVYDTRRLLPEVVLYLHAHAETFARGNGVARWEGEGPISALYIRDFLGPHCRFVVKPVIDPANMPAVDGYEIPERHREALHLRTPADVFPYAPNTGRRKDTDHTRPYRPPEDGGGPGQTGLGNLGQMTRFHHRVKTHAGWELEQPFPGVYLWKSPHGSIFLVDHTGTRQLRRPQTRRMSPGEGSGAPRSPLEDRLRALVDAA